MMAEDAVAVSPQKQRYVQAKSEQHGSSSLVARCRAVVVANLERYPAEMMGMLSEDDWEDILRSRHRKTAPQKGTGGLDGTGRRTPALTERFLSEVESTNLHLTDSSAADRLVWRDCVEYQFSRAGLTRPKGLLLPWPLLVKQLADQAAVLSGWKKKEDATERDDEPLQISGEDEKTIISAARTLKESPMNLTLLKESGVGKIVKKIIKASTTRTHKSIFKRIKMPPSGPMAARLADKGKGTSVLKLLETQLQAWMDLAASKGVDMQASSKSSASVEQFQKDAYDLKLAEECKSWRQLFSTLKERADHRREKLGQKMRDNRKRENSMRPQIVKVSRSRSRTVACERKREDLTQTYTFPQQTILSNRSDQQTVAKKQYWRKLAPLAHRGEEAVGMFRAMVDPRFWPCAKKQPSSQHEESFQALKNSPGLVQQ